MWMRAEYVVLLLVVSSNWQWVASTEDRGRNERNEHAELLDSLLLTLQQLAKFYNREYQNVNLDSIYGVRVAEGALKSTLEDINSGASRYPTPKVLFTINNLYTQFSGIARKSLHYLESSTPDYYARFSKVVAEPWNYFKGYKRLDHTVAIPLLEKKEISFAEEMSDRCMVGLMGSANRTAQPCQISEDCWKLMSTRGYKEYVTTHQALFFILGDLQGCRRQLESNLKMSGNIHTIEEQLGQFCSDIYPEMVHIEEEGYSVHERDLFMEQGIVCGMLGYYEYLDEERLLKILSWKTPQGCYGFRTKREADEMLGDEEEEQGAMRKRIADPVSWSQDQSHTQRKLMSMDTRRKLLVEATLAGGCMAHMTGVAVGLLGVYVKWMIATVDADDDSVPGTHVISARSIYSYGSLFDNTLTSVWLSLGLVLTVAAVLFILFKNRTLRLIKRLLNLTSRMTMQKDMKYIY